MSPPRTIAFFDFDATLSKGDSLWPFLVAAAGRWRCYAALARGIMAYLLVPPGKDRRTVIKDSLLQHTLGGLRVADLAPAIERMKSWPRWIEPAYGALLRHRAQGDHIVIATGSLDLYVETMLGDLPHDGVLCTRMEVVDGVLTGRMASGNCVRRLKAQLVAEYLATHGPFEESWGYGNAPHDLPMMELLDHRVVI